MAALNTLSVIVPAEATIGRVIAGLAVELDRGIRVPGHPCGRDR
jgi:hypothetical protein